jgi:hypothetical protein
MIKRSNLMNCTFPELGIAQHFASPMMIDYCCLQLFRLFNSSDLTKKVSLRNEATASGTVSDFWGSSSVHVQDGVSHHFGLSSIGRRFSARILSSLLLRGIAFSDEAGIQKRGERACTMLNRMLLMQYDSWHCCVVEYKYIFNDFVLLRIESTSV